MVARYADRVNVMYAGKIVEQATTSEIFHRTSHPYTEALLRSIPKIDQPSHTRLAAIAGRPPDLADSLEGCSFSPRCPYAQQRCVEEEPQLEALATDHLSACWYPVGTPENQEAWEKNLSAGRPSTLSIANGQKVDFY